MKVTIEMVNEEGADTEGRRVIVATLERSGKESPKAGMGLRLQEARSINRGIQEEMLAAEAGQYVRMRSSCSHCQRSLGVKGQHEIVYRTPFGKARLTSPRLYSTCRCGQAASKRHRTFSPLADALADRTHPQLLFLQTSWAAILPYRKAATLLRQVLPLEDSLAISSTRAQVEKLGRRLEEELGARTNRFYEDKTVYRYERPSITPDCAIELDAGHVRSDPRLNYGRRWMSVVASRIIGPEGAATCHGFVANQICNSSIRLHEFLNGEGVTRD